MTLSPYASTRTFQSPFGRRTETVGGGAVIGALLYGPLYYWRKQAPVEALLLVTSELVLFVLSNRMIDGAGAIDSTTPSLVLWLGAALLAPMLLPLCYRRKGWTEIATF